MAFFYLCHCGEWVMYSPRTEPHLYSVSGPKTRHHGHQVDLINVPHTPLFTFEVEALV